MNPAACERTEAAHLNDTKTAQVLRQRIADYCHLRTVTRDKKMLEAIDQIVAKAEEQLNRLDAGAWSALRAEYAATRPA